MIAWLQTPSTPLPDTRQAGSADSDIPGLLAAGGELSVQRLLEAYSKGVFPWFSPGQPVLWWSPDPRMVLPVAQFKLSRSLRKTLHRFSYTPGCEVRIDSNFDAVIQHCAATSREGQSGTWIVPDMVEAYRHWHAQGAVHSVETWMQGELVGGLYGINLGHMFFGESMFSLRTDASKIALAALVCFCREHQIPLIDCQQNTHHLASLGAHEVSRDEFEHHLSLTVGTAPITDWTYHPGLWKHLL